VDAGITTGATYPPSCWKDLHQRNKACMLHSSTIESLVISLFRASSFAQVRLSLYSLFFLTGCCRFKDEV